MVEYASSSTSNDPRGSCQKLKISEYWFNDGDIILQVEDTQFRVHSSMLARHSEVFSGILSIPQPHESMDATTGKLPVIFLSDKVDDVEVLMSIFYDGIRCVFCPFLSIQFFTLLKCRAYDLRNRLKFSQVSAMFRLGKKYCIDHLKNEAIARLRHDFPSDFDSWDKLWEDPDSGDIIYDEDLTWGIIDLACRETSLLSIIPAAYIYFIFNVPVVSRFTSYIVAVF